MNELVNEAPKQEDADELPEFLRRKREEQKETGQEAR